MRCSVGPQNDEVLLFLRIAEKPGSPEGSRYFVPVDSICSFDSDCPPEVFVYQRIQCVLNCDRAMVSRGILSKLSQYLVGSAGGFAVVQGKSNEVADRFWFYQQEQREADHACGHQQSDGSAA